MGRWELEVVGRWSLGIGSCQMSIKNSVDKPLLRVARSEQPIRRAIGQRDVPFVAIPPIPLAFSPPVPRCAPWTGTYLDAPAIHAAAIDRHACRLAIGDTHSRGHWMTKATQREDGP